MAKSELAYGVFYTAAAKYSGIIVSLVISAILARLLSPEDFGTITIATVILSFFAILSDLGIAPAIVQNKELSKSDINSIFSFTGYLGVVVSLIFFLISPIITNFYSVDSLLNICKLLSINLFFSALNIVPNALLLKTKRFKFIAIRTVSVQVLLGIIAIIAAFSSVGMYSLLIAPIGSSITIFFVNYLQNPLKFSFSPRVESLKKIASFSAYQFLFSVINYFSRNLDNLLIGKYIGVVDLGFYDKSYRLMMLPLSNITHVITPVLHPILSEHQNDRDYIFNAYLKLLRLLSYIGFPLSVLLYFQSANIITIVFGNQWAESVPIFQILAISVAPQILNSTLGSIFQSTNETKKLFFIGNINTAVNVSAIISGIVIFGSIEAVATFVCCAFYCNLLVSFSYLFIKVFNKSPSLLFTKLINPILLSVCSVALCYCLSNVLSNSFISLGVTAIFVLILSLLFAQLSKDYDVFGLIKKVVCK